MTIRARSLGTFLAAALALTASAFIAPSALPQTSGAQGQSEANDPTHLQRNFPLSAGGTLSVENRKGTIHITASDSNQVQVSVYKKFIGDEKYRERWLADTRVNFTNDANRVSVYVEYAEINCTFCGSIEDGVELTITVPRQTNLELNGDKPDVAVAGIQGHVHITSEKSPIAIRSTSGEVRIRTQKGDVTLQDVTIQGGLEITSEKADATIEAKSVSGEANIENERGNIILRLPSSVGAELDYDGGRHANFHCDFPVTVNENGMELRDVHAKMSESETHITGRLNQGGARMRLHTDRGSVSIEKIR